MKEQPWKAVFGRWPLVVRKQRSHGFARIELRIEKK
jgi:hypothetical protein